MDMVLKKKKINPVGEKLYRSHGRPCHLSTIPIKNFYISKVAESVFNFYLKLYNFKQVKVFYWNGGLHYLSTMRAL